MNSLRSTALNQTFFLLYEYTGDFLVSSSLHRVLSDANKAAEIVRKCEDHSLIVVPAFEVNALRFRGVGMRNLAKSSVKLKKQAFVQLVRSGSIQKFDEGRDLPEQSATGRCVRRLISTSVFGKFCVVC